VVRLHHSLLLFGGNVQRQEEQVAAGELENVDIQRALLTAGGQAAIEGIAGRILALAPFVPAWAACGRAQVKAQPLVQQQKSQLKLRSR
jgi:RsiW-degrading membrane proteinase PrsW (M82 family)